MVVGRVNDSFPNSLNAIGGFMAALTLTALIVK
jgi:hypothetical protein